MVGVIFIYARWRPLFWSRARNDCSKIILRRTSMAVFFDKPIFIIGYKISLNYLGLTNGLRFFPCYLEDRLHCNYVTGRRLFDRRTGLFVAIILATTPLYLLAHYANLDLEVAVLISCTLLCLICGAIDTLLSTLLRCLFFCGSCRFNERINWHCLIWLLARGFSAHVMLYR